MWNCKVISLKDDLLNMKRLIWIALSVVVVIASAKNAEISHDLTPKQAVNYDLIALCLMSLKHID